MKVSEGFANWQIDRVLKMGARRVHRVRLDIVQGRVLVLDMECVLLAEWV